MLTEEQLIDLLIRLTQEELRNWVENGWVQPERRAGGCYYREIDVARVRLICEIKEDLNVRHENIPLVLSLIDQIHGLRGQITKLAVAIDAQPAEVKRDIARRLNDG